MSVHYWLLPAFGSSHVSLMCNSVQRLQSTHGAKPFPSRGPREAAEVSPLNFSTQAMPICYPPTAAITASFTQSNAPNSIACFAPTTTRPMHSAHVFPRLTFDDARSPRLPSQLILPYSRLGTACAELYIFNKLYWL